MSDWYLLARFEQLPPLGSWLTWLLLGGRGAGKTRAGSEWVHDIATSGRLMGNNLTYGRIALVAETLSDAREVMIDGDSGILNVAKRDRPVFEVTRRRVLWPNGAIAQIFSSEDPESLRGPQFDAAWCDELCKWRFAQETWDMLQFGLRLGASPRQLITTTPKPSQLLETIMEDQLTRIMTMRTDENEGNLAASFLHSVRARYGKTRLGRQELDGQIIKERSGALWSREQIEGLRLNERPELTRIIVAVDPPVSAEAKNSCCGIIVAGQTDAQNAIVLEDGSITNAKPHQWSERVASLYQQYEADLVVAEINQGGDMVKSVLHATDQKLPIQMVRATRGKWIRAEPVAALYEAGKVYHLGQFEELEDQMCNFTSLGLMGPSDKGQSPDRLDALVWALSALCLGTDSKPNIRSL